MTDPVAAAVAEDPAENVIVALTRVMRDLPGIGKTEHASQDQGGYAYRGIEAITRHAQQLFARHGILPIPRVESWERDEVLVGRDNKLWHDEKLQVVYRMVHGPTMTEVEVGPLYSIGRDGTDKGVNKAMTQVLKYVLLQTLLVGDKADDADGTTDYAERPGAGPVWLSDEAIDRVSDRLLRLGKITGAYPDAWIEHRLPSRRNLCRLTEDQAELVETILGECEAAVELGGDVLPPLPSDVGPEEPHSAGEGSTDGERVAEAPDGEPPASSGSAEDWSELTDAQIVVVVEELRAVGRPIPVELIDLALDRGIDLTASALDDEGDDDGMGYQ
jgi:ERF superfamily